MHKIFAKTLFLGKNVYFLPECHSTNDIALERISKNEAMEGDIILSDHQTNGKGQRGNVWESEKGKNLIMSLILSPKFLLPSEQFSLHLMCSLAVYDTFFGYLGHKLKIKWPNDLLYMNRKIAGILIENVLRGNKFEYSVVGIGFNINQTHFNHKTATSLKDITNQDFNISNLIESLLLSIEKRYQQLRNGGRNIMMNEYYTRMYKFNEIHLYEADGVKFHGTINGIDQHGRLIIDRNGNHTAYNFKEVKFV